MQFTDKYIANLKPKADRYIVKEDSGHGNGKLAMRVSPNGNKSWQYLYTFGGQDRRMTMGAYPAMSVAEAHAAVGDAMRKRERGIDPGAATVESNIAAREAPTFKTLAAMYMEQWARKRKKSADRDERALQRDVLPTWGPHKAESIQKKDVRALLNAIVDRGAPIQANRMLALIRKLFNWAMEVDLVPNNPCLGVKALAAEHRRDRVLSNDEIRTLLAQLPTAAMADESKLALQLLLLTAQRCGEVLAVRWDEIDLAGGWWTIPSAKAKNKMAHRVPLSPQALEILRQARLLNPDRQTVFPSPRGDSPMVETAVARALSRNLPHIGTPHFTPHDLRRSAASGMTSTGTQRLVVGMILNHVDRSVTAIYDRHSYDGDKRAALDAWGRHVDGLTAGARLAAVEDVETVAAVAPPTAAMRSARVRERMRAVRLARGA